MSDSDNVLDGEPPRSLTDSQIGSSSSVGLRFADVIPPSKWAVYISGFRQHEANRTGIEDAWIRARSFVSQDLIIVYKTWKEDFDALAERIHRISGQNARVLIVGYSWGVGRGARKLSWSLRSRGISVEKVISCDGIYKPKFWLTSWLALTGFPTIVFPDTVRALWWCRQAIKLPCGHKIKIKRRKNVPPAVVLTMDHLHIDESDEFQNAALEAMRELEKNP